MSKQDFVALADAIREHNKYEGDKFTDDQLNTLASFCRGRNSAFMESRWMDYIVGKCGKSGGAIKAPK